MKQKPEKTIKVPIEIISDKITGEKTYKYDDLPVSEIAKAIHFYRMLKEIQDVVGINFNVQNNQPQEVHHIALTVPEAAKRLQCSAATISRLIRQKKMDGIYFKIGNRTFINAVLLENWVLKGGTAGLDFDDE